MIGDIAVGRTAPRYRELERDSSSSLLDHDSRRVLGRYEDAAFHALEAGRQRASMGKIMFDAEDRVGAAEDWLSATACFLLATAEEQGRALLDLLHRLESEGDFGSRRDLSGALVQRDQDLRELVAKRATFLRQLALPGYQLDDANQSALDFLLEQRRELPGYALLHYVISRQAMELGRQELADRHLVWAAAFDPENANLIALLGYLHLRRRRRDRAIELANGFLADNASAAGPVRIMLANALCGAQDEPLDREGAIEALRPMIDDNWPNRKERIAALAISAAMCYETGRNDELARHVDALRSIEKGLGEAELSAYTYIKLCEESLAHARSATDCQDGGVAALPESKRQQFFHSAMQLTTRLPPPLEA